MAFGVNRRAGRKSGPFLFGGLTVHRRGVISPAPKEWGWKVETCMRGDMPKVIVERSRRGGGRLRREKTFRDDELALSKMGVRRYAELRGANKGLNENLNPLRRYLEKQVDRPWNKVWSDICANLKPSSTVQQHVRDHIPDFVAIKTSLRDGKVWVHDRWSITPLKESFVRLYVDPKTGILRRNRHWTTWQARWRHLREAQEAALDARMKVIGPEKQFHLFGGTWWEVTLAEGSPGQRTRITGPHVLPGRQTPVIEPDVIIRAGFSKLSRKELYGRDGVYAVAKRQLSKREMRDQGLRSGH